MNDKTLQVMTQIFSDLREVENRVEDIPLEAHSIQVPLLEPISIEEARQYILTHWDKGISCPCCGQRVQRYARPITSSMAWGLCKLYEYFCEHPEEKWVHVEAFFNSQEDIPFSFRGDFAKLRYWSLIEMLDERREDGSSHNGCWRITSRGIAFVRGDISVSSHAYIYDGHVLGFSDDPVTIREALKNKFNYDNLMEGKF